MTRTDPPPTASQDQSAAQESSLFAEAIGRYNDGAPVGELITDFLAITEQAPRQSSGWTCLAWLQLLNAEPLAALKSARVAVRLNPQDPQARVNLSLAMLETGTKGVREHVEIARRLVALAPELASDLDDAIGDGLARRPDWAALGKVKAWLDG